MGALKLWTGAAWVTVTINGTIFAATAPTAPALGQSWYDTTNQILKIWDGTTWKPATFSADVDQTTLFEGGLHNFSSSFGIAWSAAFVIRVSTQLTNEFTTVTMPANGVVITGYGAASSQTVASGYIPLASGTTLYYDVPAGGSSSTDNSRFKIAGSDYAVPRTWVPIVFRDFSTAAAPLIFWGDGQVGWDGDAGGVIGPFTGSWSASNPPNSTSGSQFTIARTGVYRLDADVGGYSAVGGVTSTFTHFIDGAQQAARNHFFNTANEHSIPLHTAWVQTLTAGTHYWWVKFTHQSNADDNALLTWTRL